MVPGQLQPWESFSEFVQSDETERQMMGCVEGVLVADTEVVSL